MGVSLWLSICVFACLWFVSRFMTGRRQLQNNLHVIEDGLRRMQEEIERRQRENSISYGENLEEIMEELKKDGLMNEDLKEKEEQDKEAKPGKEALEAEPLLVQDKKND
ncbi:hypothetical protein TcasGA2_TC000604 [Tribolium castaneum]|uniref:Uncharacterized protein n=2 Tax=Tribolium castaneum TaxID=7070 RepID=D6W9D6_TRICA|nr:hypothetical protein TcasGA2_TC000604 [Tribolium castaneum]